MGTFPHYGMSVLAINVQNLRSVILIHVIIIIAFARAEETASLIFSSPMYTVFNSIDLPLTKVSFSGCQSDSTAFVQF